MWGPKKLTFNFPHISMNLWLNVIFQKRSQNENHRIASVLTLWLLVVNLVNTKWCMKVEKLAYTLTCGYSSVDLKSFLLNLNMTGFRWFSKIIFLPWTKIVSACKGLNVKAYSYGHLGPYYWKLNRPEWFFVAKAAPFNNLIIDLSVLTTCL